MPCLLGSVCFLPKVKATHPDCAIILHFQEKEAECLEIIRRENQSREAPGCLTEWDGVNCWPAELIGQSRVVFCPDILEVFKEFKVPILRNCTESGWSSPQPPYDKACELDSGSHEDTEAKRVYFVIVKMLYTCGYVASLTALLLAICIFSFFRKLHCTRNFIHIHFFTSFVLRGAAVLIKDAVLFADETNNHCTMSTVNCKAAITFFQYSVLANFYWLLVEGMYLQTLLLLTFTSDKSYFWWYILIGWGEPFLSPRCWDNYTNLYRWVIQAPILFAIFVNFLIFLNVIWMLLQKIRSPDFGRNYKQKYMRLTKSTLLLIPLFGVHYVMFALFPEHIGVEARLYFELVLGSYQVQAELKRNWGTWQSSMESNVFNVVTQEFTT
uniref:Vasoactive intestinal polypeptide receptor 1 n=1 Tax=Sphenodon punctatus TaxID=8508 RepID=A0A8D0GSL3_SPHPU